MYSLFIPVLIDFVLIIIIHNQNKKTNKTKPTTITSMFVKQTKRSEEQFSTAAAANVEKRQTTTETAKAQQSEMIHLNIEILRAGAKKEAHFKKPQYDILIICARILDATSHSG